MEEEKGILNTSLQNKSIVGSITDTIIKAIVNGELKPGDKIPTEIELCNSLGVGRNSVREAIKKLEAYGVVHIKRAEGTFVSDTYTEQMLDPLLYGIILQENFWYDFIELRTMVDIGTMYVVGRKCSNEDLEPIRDAMRVLEKVVRDMNTSVEEIMNADSDFHKAIAKLGDNDLLQSVTGYVTRMTIPSRMITIGNILEKGDRDNFIELHRQLLKVLEEKKFEQIEKAVLDHYIYWREKK